LRREVVIGRRTAVDVSAPVENGCRVVERRVTVAVVVIAFALTHNSSVIWKYDEKAKWRGRAFMHGVRSRSYAGRCGA